MEVCPSYGVIAGLVGQVEQLAGRAGRDFQAPPAGLTTLLHVGSRK